MGGSASTQARVNMGITNNALQNASSSCSAVCNQDMSGNNVIIAPGANVGNITFKQVCTIEDTNCMLTTLLETNLTNILDSNIDQATTATQPIMSLAFTSAKTSTSLDQQITNQISQMISSTCLFDVNQTMNGNYVYVGTGATAKDITFAQNAEITSVECAIDITSKAIAYNEAKNKLKQSTTLLDPLSLLAMGMALIGIFIVIGIIIVVVTLAKKGYSVTQNADGSASFGPGSTGSGK